VRGEIDLAKVKGQRMAKEVKPAVVMLGAAGVLALFTFGLLLGSLTVGLSHVMPLWAAFLVVALALIVIAVPLALIGIKRLKAAKAEAPAPQEGLRESVTLVKDAIASGRERGNAQ
ncbi:phage holin family protein, partial [uncultured Actinomyces sp.]|uniref:phage holin family protein n=1 Tax=uncultured Actinomyces sp. TaxID=249061 RepID=UPI0028D00ADC